MQVIHKYFIFLRIINIAPNGMKAKSDPTLLLYTNALASQHNIPHGILPPAFSLDSTPHTPNNHTGWLTVRLSAYIREVLRSNSFTDFGYADGGLYGFPQSRQAFSRTVPKLGLYRFLPYPF
jgi:hypothetical protein